MLDTVTRDEFFKDLPELKEPLSTEDVQAIYESALSTARAGKERRDGLLIQLLAYTGLRISEVVVLQAGDFFHEDKVLKVTRLKKRAKTAPEVIHIPTPLVVSILERRLQLQSKKDLLIGLTRKGAYDVVNRNGWAALDRNVHPHQFRVYFVTTLLERGYSPDQVAKLVGHADSKVTWHYYYLLSEKKKRSMVDDIPSIERKAI